MAGILCLLWLAASLLPGCLGDEEWKKYNLAPGEPCQSDEYCQSGFCKNYICHGNFKVGERCSSDADCASGICRIRACQSSTRSLGLNCAQNSDCNSQFCIYIVQGKGVCSLACTSTSCPDGYLCATVLMASGVYENYCFYRCIDSTGCDTNSFCAQYEVDAEWSCLPKSTF